MCLYAAAELKLSSFGAMRTTSPYFLCTSCIMEGYLPLIQARMNQSYIPFDEIEGFFRENLMR